MPYANCFATNETGVNFIAGGISNCMNSQFGDPLMLGLIVLGFFVAFVMLQRTGMDAKVVILAPACVLAMLFIPSLIWFMLAMFGVFVVYKVLKKENQG